MTLDRAQPTATLLLDGKVLVAGGAHCLQFECPISQTAELYDPHTSTFTQTGDMTSPHAGHTATLLPNRNVLVAGGDSGESAVFGGAVVAACEEINLPPP